jgi:hypothetical protein
MAPGGAQPARPDAVEQAPLRFDPLLAVDLERSELPQLDPRHDADRSHLGVEGGAVAHDPLCGGLCTRRTIKTDHDAQGVTYLFETILTLPAQHKVCTIAKIA